MDMGDWYQGETTPIAVAVVAEPVGEEDDEDVVIVDANCCEEMELPSRGETFLRRRRRVLIPNIRTPSSSSSSSSSSVSTSPAVGVTATNHSSTTLTPPLSAAAGVTATMTREPAPRCANPTGNPGMTAEEDLYAPMGARSSPSRFTASSSSSSRKTTQMVSSGLASAACGFILLGGAAPLVALAMGVGAAYASQQQGAVGDSARAVGQVAILAHKKVKEISEKHSFVERSKNAALTGWEMVKEMEQDNRYWDKTKAWFQKTWKVTKETVKPQQVVQKSTESMEKVVHFVSKQWSSLFRFLGDNHDGNATPQLHAAQTGFSRAPSTSSLFADVEPLPPYYNYSQNGNNR